jgi:hypothetical protein
MIAMELAGIAVLFIVGALLLLLPNESGAKIATFYSKYPLLRYAGAAQFKLRPAYVRAIGVVFVAVSALATWALLFR